MSNNLNVLYRGFTVKLEHLRDVLDFIAMRQSPYENKEADDATLTAYADSIHDDLIDVIRCIQQYKQDQYTK